LGDLAALEALVLQFELLQLGLEKRHCILEEIGWGTKRKQKGLA